MNDQPKLVKDENYYEVPGIDLDGKPTTFKILISDNKEPKEKNHEH